MSTPSTSTLLDAISNVGAPTSADTWTKAADFLKTTRPLVDAGEALAVLTEPGVTTIKAISILEPHLYTRAASYTAPLELLTKLRKLDRDLQHPDKAESPVDETRFLVALLVGYYRLRALIPVDLAKKKLSPRERTYFFAAERATTALHSYKNRSDTESELSLWYDNLHSRIVSAVKQTIGPAIDLTIPDPAAPTKTKASDPHSLL